MRNKGQPSILVLNSCDSKFLSSATTVHLLCTTPLHQKRSCDWSADRLCGSTHDRKVKVRNQQEGEREKSRNKGGNGDRDNRFSYLSHNAIMILQTALDEAMIRGQNPGTEDRETASMPLSDGQWAHRKSTLRLAEQQRHWAGERQKSAKGMTTSDATTSPSPQHVETRAFIAASSFSIATQLCRTCRDHGQRRIGHGASFISDKQRPSQWAGSG